MIGRALIVLAILCAALFLACYLGTGTDRRNMRSLHSYPKAVREAALRDARLAGMAPPRRPACATFLANLLLFAVVLALCGAVIGPDGLWRTFAVLLALGEALNLFDLLVIDLLWWRNSSRVRLGGIDDPELYRDWHPHGASFLRGVPMFALSALIASLMVAI